MKMFGGAEIVALRNQILTKIGQTLERMNTAEQGVVGLTTQLRERESLIERLRADIAELSSYKEKLDAKEVEMIEINSKMAEKEASIASLTQQIEDNKALVASIKQSGDATSAELKATIERLNKTIADQSEKLASAESDMTWLNSEIVVNERTAAEDKKAREELNETITRKNQEIATLTDSIKEIARKLEIQIFSDSTGDVQRSAPAPQAANAGVPPPTAASAPVPPAFIPFDAVRPAPPVAQPPAPQAAPTERISAVFRELIHNANTVAAKINGGNTGIREEIRKELRQVMSDQKTRLLRPIVNKTVQDSAEEAGKARAEVTKLQNYMSLIFKYTDAQENKFGNEIRVLKYFLCSMRTVANVLSQSADLPTKDAFKLVRATLNDVVTNSPIKDVRESGQPGARLYPCTEATNTIEKIRGDKTVLRKIPLSK
mgnify:CR=1 FL=1